MSLGGTVAGILKTLILVFKIPFTGASLMLLILTLAVLLPAAVNIVM